MDDEVVETLPALRNIRAPSPRPCADHLLHPTVFHEPWWLAAATDGNYRALTVTRGGRIVGSFPFVETRLGLGARVCGMAPLTHVLGPGIDPGDGAMPNRRLKGDGILRELLGALGTFDGFHIKMHRGIEDTLIFQENGYRTPVQFTYELAPATETQLWRGMRDKTRNAIRQAMRVLDVRELSDPARFDWFYTENLKDRDDTNRYRHIAAVCRASLAHGQGRILRAEDNQGRMVAAIFYAWDHATAYYLLSTRAVGAANGAISLLIWHAVSDAAGRGLVFDFDGVATPGSRLFYTGFGGAPAPRYIVSRFSLRHRVMNRLRSPFRPPARHTYQW